MAENTFFCTKLDKPGNYIVLLINFSAGKKYLEA